MQDETFIQTNHGVSFPLVGPQRIDQEELVSIEDDLHGDSNPLESPPLADRRDESDDPMTAASCSG